MTGRLILNLTQSFILFVTFILCDEITMVTNIHVHHNSDFHPTLTFLDPHPKPPHPSLPTFQVTLKHLWSLDSHRPAFRGIASMTAPSSSSVTATASSSSSLAVAPATSSIDAVASSSFLSSSSSSAAVSGDDSTDGGGIRRDSHDATDGSFAAMDIEGRRPSLFSPNPSF